MGAISSEFARIALKDFLWQRKELLERAGFRGMIVQPREDRHRPSIIWPASSRLQIFGSKGVRREFRRANGQALKFWREKIFLPRIEVRLERELFSLNKLIENLEQQRRETLEVNGGHEKRENYLTRIELDQELILYKTERDQVLVALDRAKKGKLGICFSCGGAISEERLDALPFAFECIVCAEAEEKNCRR